MIDERDRLIIGAPGGLTFWAFEVVKALASRHRPTPMPVIAVERLEEVAPLPPDAEGRLLLYHYPSSQAVDALTRLKLRAVTLAEPPGLVVNYLMGASGRTALESVRVCSASYVANIALRRTEGAVVLRRSVAAPVARVLAGLCDYLGLDVDPQHLAGYAAHLTSKAASDTIDDAIESFLPAATSRLPADAPAAGAQAARLIAATLEPVVALLAARAPPAISWPPESLVWTAAPVAGSAGGAVELMGPARALCHGPYLHLPPAEYDAEVVISVAGPLRGITFRLEFHAGEECLARARIEPATAGRFKGRLSFRHTRCEPEVQAQVIIERGTIEGEFALLSLTLSPRLPG